MASITDDARRRLRAIEAFSDLGSGFNIAMQDLDIRGAGNLLGGEQSGFIADMGFETYQRILAEAFIEIKQEQGIEVKQAKKGEKNKELYQQALQESAEPQTYITDCSIDTDMELLIPDSYISITSEKIRLYKELDTITTEQALDKFMEDLKDRFG
jgi:transcription-repair coupling factor (superfamily II helicase)